MKKNANKIMVLAIAIVVGVVATASASFACCDNCMGYGTNTRASLTVEQQQKLDAVKEKYSPQFDQLQTSINRKAEEYDKALANDDTTVGKLNSLEAERVDLERQYRALLDQANKEAGLSATANSGPWFACGDYGCDHQNHMGADHMGQNHQHGMYGNHMARCWQ